MSTQEEFYKGLEKVAPQESYDNQKRHLEEAAFNRIFLESEKGTMKWERLGDRLLKSEISSQSYSGDLMNIPVFLSTTATVGDIPVESAYVHLFNEKGDPCRNNNDKRVKRLLEILEIPL